MVGDVRERHGGSELRAEALASEGVCARTMTSNAPG